MVEVRGRENLALYLEDKNVWIIENRKKIYRDSMVDSIFFFISELTNKFLDFVRSYMYSL